MRILLGVLLAAALAVLAVVPAPRSLLLALLVTLLVFVVGFGKLAVDLIELVRAELVADAALLLVLAIALTRVTAGSRVLTAALLAAALATQFAPFVIRRRSLRSI
jgi:hypothetical protein